MNEIIKVSYQNESPTVLGRELHEALESARNFTEFFVKVSEFRINMSRDELKILRSVLVEFASKYGAIVITYLADAIDAERVLPCKQETPRKFKEKQMQSSLLDNFCYAFPNYNLVGAEIPVDGIGRIDILAEDKESKRAVIIELKTGSHNPNTQLLAYATKYENPILIGITETRLSLKLKNSNIIYYTFSELKEGAAQWVN